MCCDFKKCSKLENTREMSMYQLQKNFEQTLRGTSNYTSPTVVIKTEIHRGCTGKSHACGTIKNRSAIIKQNQQRKGSLSSETTTISDSGSDRSSSITSNELVVQEYPKIGRRKTIDNHHTISSDVTDKATVTPVNGRGRLYSDGDQNDDGPGEIIRTNHNRGSFRMGNGHGKSPSSVRRPPWQNVYSSKTTTPSSPTITNNNNNNDSITKQTIIQATNRVNSFRTGRYSFRRKGENWSVLWQKSFDHRPDGGVYKTLENIRLSSGKVIDI